MSGKFHWMQMNSPARITRSTAKRVMESGGGIAGNTTDLLFLRWLL